MTIIVGCQYNGGAFLLSDSLAVNVSTGYKKDATQKLYSICDGKIIIGAAGIEYDGYYLARKMERQFNSIMIEEVFQDEDTFITIFEEFIDKLHQDKNIKYKDNPNSNYNKNDNSKYSYCPRIVIAVNLKNDGVQLYELNFQYIAGEKSFTIEKVLTEYTMIGTGSVVFETVFNMYRDILSNFDSPITKDNPDLIKAILVNTIKKTNQMNLYCGGDIQIMDLNGKKGIIKETMKSKDNDISNGVIISHLVRDIVYGKNEQVIEKIFN